MIAGLPRRPRTLGQDWFDSQDDAAKETILGKEASLAYRQHDLKLNDFVGFKNDKRFGKSVRRRSLAQILADKGISDTGDDEAFLPKNIKTSFRDGTKEHLETLLGKKISDNQIGGLIGALDDAEITVAFDSRDRRNLYFDIKHPFIKQQQRTLGRDSGDRLYLYNDFFRTSETAPKGIGLMSFATEAFNAKKLKVSYIFTDAAGSPGHSRFNGYYTWARMGYNTPLTSEIKFRLPEKYRDMKDLNEVMLSGGKDDWKQFGKSAEMYFDLSSDSNSWKILENYLREKGFMVK